MLKAFVVTDHSKGKWGLGKLRIILKAFGFAYHFEGKWAVGKATVRLPPSI